MNSKISEFAFRNREENILFYLPEAILFGGLEFSILENNHEIPELFLNYLRKIFENKEKHSYYKQLKKEIRGFKEKATEIEAFLCSISKYANSSKPNRLRKFYRLVNTNIAYQGLFESRMEYITQVFCASILNILKINKETIFENINVFEAKSNSTSIYELSLILLFFFGRDCHIYNSEDENVYKKLQLSENQSELPPITIFLNKKSLQIIHFEESKSGYYTQFSEEFYKEKKLNIKLKDSKKNHEEEKIDDNINNFERILNKFKEKLILFAIEQFKDTKFISKEDYKEKLKKKMKKLYEKYKNDVSERKQNNLWKEMKDYLKKVRRNSRDLQELRNLKNEFVSKE